MMLQRNDFRKLNDTKISKKQTFSGTDILVCGVADILHSQTRMSVPLMIFAMMFGIVIKTFAQSPDTTAIRYGVGGAYLLNRHEVGFTKLDGLPSCCDREYGNASSQGWSAGVSAEFPLVRLGEIGSFGLVARVQYSSGLGANLTANSTVDIRGLNSSVVPANIEYGFAPSFSSLSIEPLATVRVLKWLSFYGGINAGTWLQRSFQYQEKIISPGNVVFENDKTTRNEQSGNIPNTNPLQISLVGGVSYELPVTRTGTVLPTLEAFYTYGLTSPVNGVNWRISSFRVGASLRFSPYRTTELTAQEIEQKYQDSIRVAQELTQKALAEAKEARKKQLDAKINDVRSVFFDDDETAENDTTARNLGNAIAAKVSLDQFELNIQRVALVQNIELLPMVFFNENSSVLSIRYKTVMSNDVAKFSTDAPSVTSSIQKSPIAAYYQVLNIVGKRLQENPQATITLTGMATEKEQDGSFLADRLAERRAQALSNYFQDVWRVNVSRITTKSRVVPASANAQENEELRRVEIASSDARILAPLTAETERRIVTPPGLQIGLQIAAGQGLKQWDLDISQSTGQEVTTLLSATGGANYPEKFVWDIRANPPPSAEDVAIRLSIDDVTNNKFESPIIAVKVKETAQKGRVDAFTLLSAESPLVSRIQSLLSATALAKRTARVRTQNAAFLQRVSVGSSAQKPLQKALFDGNLPEGRMYNRGGVVEVR